MRTTLKCNAKINLGLNIINKRNDGYHNIDSVMVPIDLQDYIKINIKNITGTLNIKIIDKKKSNIPLGKTNILYKIYNAFYKKTGLYRRKIEIILIKNIPSEAGLGGGSSNGAVFLRFLNKYHDEILSIDEMIDLTSKIGADIPFFLQDNSCRVTGTGTNLETIHHNLKANLILLKPSFGVSAQSAYKAFASLESSKNIIRNANIENIISGLQENNIYKIFNNIENHLEQSILNTNSNIVCLYNKLSTYSKDLNPSGNKNLFFMTGSGSTFFIITDIFNNTNSINSSKTSISDKIIADLNVLFPNFEKYLCSTL